MKIELLTGSRTIHVEGFVSPEKRKYRIAVYYGGVFIKEIYNCNDGAERHEAICNFMKQTHDAGCRNSSLYVRIGTGLCFFYSDGLMIAEEEIYQI